MDYSAKEYLSLSASSDEFEKAKYPGNKEQYRKWAAVVEAREECFPNYDPNGNIFYISASYAKKHEFDIYFVDTNNEYVTFDNHNDGYHSSSRSGKEKRGFYVAPTYGVDENGNLTIVKPAPKIKKIIIVSRNDYMDTAYNLMIDTATAQKAKIDKLKEYVITDVKSSSNTYTFKTNFDKERVVVTRLAYEDGFSLKMVDSLGQEKTIKAFNAQGGFVSFVSGAGECSYKLEFYTPYLKVASYISSIGVLSFFTTLLACTYLELRKEERKIIDELKR